MQDIHSVSSLLKMYFRELPNPLLTYQLYNKFVVSYQLLHIIISLYDCELKWVILRLQLQVLYRLDAIAEAQPKYSRKSLLLLSYIYSINVLWTCFKKGSERLV